MKIAITRLAEKGRGDAALCRRYGHECVPVTPLKAEVYPERVDDFAGRVNRAEFDCLFFTSALPARIIAPLLERWPRVIAIGPETARTLQHFGVSAETLPSFYSRDFAPYLGKWLEGRHVGIPRADVENPHLLDSIREVGGIPHEVRVYRLAPTGENLPLEGVDAVIFTSAGSFRHAVWNRRPGLLLIAIGEITAKAMREGGAEPRVTGDGSLEGTMQALNGYLKGRIPG
ncbi:MAG: uroporphyrinogen-III synthase [Methanomicrobiaceae archaeon]|nr:uroporphyrinogen-III synthase [Methanomicrobiaceae archaeon]